MSYLDRVQSFNPIRYWPLDDTSGTDARELIASDDGTYQGPALDNSTAPDGSPCPLFDGLNDYVDIFSAAFATAFDGAEYTIACWCKVVNSGVWSDGSRREVGRIEEIGVDETYMRKNTSDEMEWQRYDGTAQIYADPSFSGTDWFHMAITVSETDGEMVAYRDGAAVYRTKTLGSWTSTIDDAFIGANTSGGPQHHWSGWLAHYAVWDSALSGTDIAELARITYLRRGIVHLIGNVNDCDGAEIGDINDNGKQDVACIESTGTPRVFWFKQGTTPDRWTQYTVYTGGTKHEGVTLGDFNGDGEVEIISLDQSDGIIRLHKPTSFEDPEGSWTTVSLQTGRVNLQDAQAIDLDGDGRPEIVYTWEGSGVGSGGVNWLDWDSGAVTTPANWTDRVMIQREGAWWLASSGPLDMAGNGRDDFVFSSRDGRNANADPGIYWLEMPVDPTTSPWTENTIDATVADWVHCDWGDFSGNGTERDVLAYVLDSGGLGPVWYDYDSAWARTQLLDPGEPVVDDRFNIRKSNLRSATPNDFLFVVEEESMYLYQEINGEYVNHPVLTLDYIHPLDDRLIWYDIDGDGEDELIVPDSGGNRLIWIDFMDITHAKEVVLTVTVTVTVVE